VGAVQVNKTIDAHIILYHNDYQSGTLTCAFHTLSVALSLTLSLPLSALVDLVSAIIYPLDSIKAPLPPWAGWRTRQ
jgi:hypothetical protein